MHKTAALMIVMAMMAAALLPLAGVGYPTIPDDPPYVPPYTGGDFIQSVTITSTNSTDWNYIADGHTETEDARQLYIASVMVVVKVPTATDVDGWGFYLQVFGGLPMNSGTLIHMAPALTYFDETWASVDGGVNKSNVVTYYFEDVENSGPGHLVIDPLELTRNITYWFKCMVLDDIGRTADSWAVGLELEFSQSSEIKYVDLYRTLSSTGAPQLFLHQVDDTEFAGNYPRTKLAKMEVNWEHTTFWTDDRELILSNTTILFKVTNSTGGSVLYTEGQIDDIYNPTFYNPYYNCTAVLDFEDKSLWEPGAYTFLVTIKFDLNGTGDDVLIDTHEFQLYVNSSQSYTIITYGDLLSWGLGFPGLLIFMFGIVAGAWRFKNGDSSIGAFVFAMVALLIGGVMIYVGFLGGIT